MQRCIIIGAAPVKNYKKIRSFLHKDDFIITCDGGLNHLKKLKVKPDLIVGDFDSHKNPHLPAETIVLPREKDDTDSVFALKTALSRGFSDFLFIGMTGARFDHSLANLSLLLTCRKAHAHAVLLDDFSEMQIAGSDEIKVKDNYSYFSLLCITGPARKITIKDAKYPLNNADFLPESQYGISNEVPKGKTARITVSEGELLLVKVW
ncbi:thiamine diphosphokinase [Treponema sp.]|uniref:thiamine diphosphokinase n=1 Tax=Treponema sp. TaxID=166 RepID=UPI00388E0DFD